MTGLRLRRATVEGSVTAPGSKSQTHRAYILAARSDAPATVASPLRAADTDATLACLHRLGAQVRLDDREVTFTPAAFCPTQDPLDCRNAGTALRLLSAQAATLPFPVTLTGDSSLRNRPNGPLLDALRTLGVRVEGAPDGRAPFTIQGPMHPGTVQVPGAASSQFASALLLALPLLAGPSTLMIDGPPRSRPYIDLTLETARAFGIQIDGDGPFSIHGPQTPRAAHFPVEGDWSAAAFPLAAAAVTGGTVTVRGVRTDTKQGDHAICEHLAAFGAKVHQHEGSVTVQAGELTAPGALDIGATPDLFPVLAIVAACARGKTVFTGGQSLREKESDRIAAMAQGLQAMGIDARPTADGMRVHGGRLQGARVRSHDDHRIHMAFCVAALAADGTTHVDGIDTVAISYPRFHADLASLGAAIQTEAAA